MAANPDFKDMFIALNDAGAEYLVVGALAVAFHAEPRYSKDIDIWVRGTSANADRVLRALAAFTGAPAADISAGDLQNPETVYQIGVAPNRIDILAGVEGIEFDAAWPRRVQSTYDGVPVPILGKDDLIRAKRTSGRPQDLLDIERLSR